jgi:hypothetical protein
MQDRKPNILFILTDQQRRDSMRAYGNNWIKTPNLDKLADKSFVFENAYVTQPVCTPARAPSEPFCPRCPPGKVPPPAQAIYSSLRGATKRREARLLLLQRV